MKQTSIKAQPLTQTRVEQENAPYFNGAERAEVTDTIDSSTASDANVLLFPTATKPGSGAEALERLDLVSLEEVILKRVDAAIKAKLASPEPDNCANILDSFLQTEDAPFDFKLN